MCEHVFHMNALLAYFLQASVCSGTMYTLRKAKKIFFHTLALYNRKKESLDPHIKQEAKETLEALQAALIAKDRKQANSLAQKAREFAKGPLARPLFVRFCTSLFGLIIALGVALLVRSMWFELYEIPSGSMRPTFKEQDRLVVSKTTFGINVPLQPSHFLFEPNLTKRAGVFIFSGQGMDIENNDALYFYLIPGKKQYIKRLMGKPGDRLYFYGGQVYGIDKDGQDISPLLEPEILDHIDHIPFLSFNGKLVKEKNGFILYQMGQPIAKLSVTPFGTIKGIMIANAPTYGDLWGIKHFAMTRLVTKRELPKTPSLPDAPLYLELSHSPTLDGSTLTRYGISIKTETSYIPLQDDHIQAIMNAMYTARFTVKNGRAYRLERGLTPDAPKIDGVPDGTYEFYHGTACKVGFGGITTPLPKTHPIYSPKYAKLFYNLGIDFTTYQTQPNRYAYYRGCSLYLLGAPFLHEGDKTLDHFIQSEYARAEVSLRPYTPFVNYDPPVTKEGQIDQELLANVGLAIPEGHYLALGDNHAMSLDSRVFGFIPEGNIRGAPSFIFWPPGSRFGPPLQIPYPLFTLPNIIVYSAVLLIFLLYMAYSKKRHKLPAEIE